MLTWDSSWELRISVTHWPGAAAPSHVHPHQLHIVESAPLTICALYLHPLQRLVMLFIQQLGPLNRNLSFHANEQISNLKSDSCVGRTDKMTS
jgi:hypothetical protein